MRYALKLSFLLSMLLGVTALSHAQLPQYQNFCQDGGQPVITQGLSSTTLVQASYPRCLVTVFNAGTSNLSIIFSTTGGTPLSNPFNANVDGSFVFFAAATCYDIQISGGTPNPMPGPFTYSNVCLGGGGGGGGGSVTSVTGTVNQINVANPVTTPALSIASPFVFPGSVTFPDIFLQNGSLTGAVTVKAQSNAGTWTFQWPNSAGTNGQCMATDGTGIMGWTTCGGGGGGGGTPGGLNSQLQVNNAGAFGGLANAATGSVLASQGTSTFPIFQTKPYLDVRDFTGATSDVQITNTIAALPAGGGEVNAFYTTNQSWAACPTFGTGNVHLLLHSVSYAIAVNCTIPPNVTLEFQQGALLAPAAGITVIVSGSVMAGNRQKIVNIANGTVQFTGSSRIYAGWYGAIQDLVVDDALGTQAALDANPGRTVYLAAGIAVPCTGGTVGAGCTGAPSGQFLTQVIMRKNDTTLAMDTSQNWPDGGAWITVPNTLGTPAIWVNQNCYGCALQHIHLRGPNANAWSNSDLKTFINPSQTAMDGLDNDGITISAGHFHGEDIGAQSFLRHGIFICGNVSCDSGQPDFWLIEKTFNVANRGFGLYAVGGDSGGGLGLGVNGRGNGFGEVGDWVGAGGGGNTWINLGDELSARNTIVAGSTQALTACTVTANVNSCTTAAGNTFQQSSWVTISGFTDTTFNGTCKLTSATNANPFTCAFTHANGTASAGSPVAGTSSSTSVFAQISATHNSAGVQINVGNSYATGAGNVQILGGFAEPASVSFGLGTIVQGLIVTGGTILANQQHTTITSGTTGTTVTVPSTPGTANFNIIDAEDQPQTLNLQAGISADQNVQIKFHGFDSTPGDVSGPILYTVGTTSDVFQIQGSAGVTSAFLAGSNATKHASLRGLAVGSGDVNLQQSAGSGIVNFYGGGAGVLATVNATGKGSFNGGVSAGATGTNGVYSWVGSTSGTATITGPAIAGTATNPLVSTNAISAPNFNATGANGGLTGTEGTGAALTAGAGTDLFYPDSTKHCWHQNLNNVDVGCSITANTSGLGFGSVFGAASLLNLNQTNNTVWGWTMQNGVATSGGAGGLASFVDNNGDGFIGATLTGGTVVANVGLRQSGDAFLNGNGSIGNPASVSIDIPSSATADFVLSNGSGTVTGSPRLIWNGKAGGKAVVSFSDVSVATPNPIWLPTATATTAGQMLTSNAANPQQTSWVTPVTSYDHSGTVQTATHMVRDRCTLGTSCSVTLVGSAVFTSSSTYDCVAIDRTGANAIQFAPSSGSAFALTGTGTDTISYVCVGN